MPPLPETPRSVPAGEKVTAAQVKEWIAADKAKVAAADAEFIKYASLHEIHNVLPPYVDGFKTDYIEASQLVYTLTRPDVYNAIIGCHADGMNRGDNDLRDWLDKGGSRLPKGEHGVDGWIDDEEVVAQVRELYPPSSVMRPRIEDDRRVFLAAMSKMKREMILGPDKSVYVEPTIWTIEWAQKFYKYAPTRSNRVEPHAPVAPKL